MFEIEPDMILMPHSAPTPRIPIVDRLMDDMVAHNARRYAAALGVPTVLANKVLGPTSTPVPGIPGVRIPWKFRGFSTVCDANGAVLDQLVDREGVVLAEVSLGDAGEPRDRPAADGYWAFPPPMFSRVGAWLWQAFDRRGRRAYAKSRKRS
jgi:predicted amidohydrolase